MTHIFFIHNIEKSENLEFNLKLLKCHKNKLFYYIILDNLHFHYPYRKYEINRFIGFINRKGFLLPFQYLTESQIKNLIKNNQLIILKKM